MGFLGSFVQQVSLDPPTVMVAVAKGREHLDAIRAAGRFGVSVLGEEDKGLMKPFFKKPEDGSPFDDVAHTSAPDGAGVGSESERHLISPRILVRSAEHTAHPPPDSRSPGPTCNSYSTVDRQLQSNM